MSSLPSDLPKLPKWPFILFDVLLVSTACLIAWNHSGDLSGTALLSVVGCVVLAAILCAIPFLADYARAQDAALDERQRALEALGRTVASSAEQIGIAAQGLHEIAEKTHRALKEAEALPKKLQEKLAELQLRLDTAKDEELEELERDIAALRASEGEKLESAADKVGKAAAELVKLDGSVSKQLQALSETLGRAQGEAGRFAEKITQSTDDCTSRVVAALARTIQAAQEDSQQKLSEEHQRVLDGIAKKLDVTLEMLEVRTARAADSIQSKIALMESVVANLKAATAEASRLTPVAAGANTAPVPSSLDSVSLSETAPLAEAVQTVEVPVPAPAEEPELPANQDPESAPALAAPPKKARKARRQAEEVPQDAVEPQETPTDTAEPAVEDKTPLLTEELPEAELPLALEMPAPMPEPPVEESAPATPPEIVELPAATPREPVPSQENPEPAENFSQEEPETSQPDTAISADGATRLIVTAYIGIGNRLYIRGDGPGLSWDKGLPLQFVSIGKWRWESADAVGPVHIRLLKNDQQECPNLGELVLNPGHQAEVTASF